MNLNSAKKIKIIVLAVMLVACANENPAFDEFARLCNKDAGASVYRVVEAEGYYDDTAKCLNCWQLIVGTNFKFIEFCDESPGFWYSVSEPGCWRVSRVDRADGQCDEQIDKKALKFAGSQTFQKYLSKYCFVKRQLDTPEAEYGSYLTIDETRLDNKDRSIIQRHEQSIKKIDTGEVVAQEVDYVFMPAPEGHTNRVMARRCSYIEGGYQYTPFFVREVIKSRED